VYYFAYGSNMLCRRLSERIGSVSVLGTAALPRHLLRFHKRSRDNSGKCNAFFTGHVRDHVYGVVFGLSHAQQQRLHACEGAGYVPLIFKVKMDNAILRVTTYIATPDCVVDGLTPFDWYHALVLAGARQHDLPSKYVSAIASMAVRPDPDLQRARTAYRLLRYDARAR